MFVVVVVDDDDDDGLGFFFFFFVAFFGLVRFVFFCFGGLFWVFLCPNYPGVAISSAFQTTQDIFFCCFFFCFEGRLWKTVSP